MKLTGMIAIGSIAAASVAVPVSYSVIHNHQEHQKTKRSSRIASTRTTTTAVNTFKGTMNLSSDFNAITTTVDYAQFYNEEHIEEISMPQVTTVGDFAFNKSNIKRIDLPEVTSIGKYAFSNSLITNLNLPKLSRVGKNAFVGIVNKHSTTVTLPGSFHSNYVLDRLFGTGKYNNINFTFSRSHTVPAIEQTVHAQEHAQEIGQVNKRGYYALPNDFGNKKDFLGSEISRKAIWMDDNINELTNTHEGTGKIRGLRINDLLINEEGRSRNQVFATLDESKVKEFKFSTNTSYGDKGVYNQSTRNARLNEYKHGGAAFSHDANNWISKLDWKLTRDSSKSFGWKVSILDRTVVGRQFVIRSADNISLIDSPNGKTWNVIVENSETTSVNNKGIVYLQIDKKANGMWDISVSNSLKKERGEDGYWWWLSDMSLSDSIIDYSKIISNPALFGIKKISMHQEGKNDYSGEGVYTHKKILEDVSNIPEGAVWKYSFNSNYNAYKHASTDLWLSKYNGEIRFKINNFYNAAYRDYSWGDEIYLNKWFNISSHDSMHSSFMGFNNTHSYHVRYDWGGRWMGHYLKVENGKIAIYTKGRALKRSDPSWSINLESVSMGFLL